MIGSQRLGPIQKKLMQWVTEGGRVHIGDATVPPYHLGLQGYSMNEVGPSLARLVQRGVLESDKPGFYCLPGWKPTPEWLGI